MFDRLTRWVARWTGSKWAFVLAFLSILAWAACGPFYGYSDSWSLVVNTGTTIVTFLMCFMIQATQNRDGAAVQAKLDELIRAVEGARNDLIGAERRTEEEIAALAEPDPDTAACRPC